MKLKLFKPTLSNSQNYTDQEIISNKRLLVSLHNDYCRETDYTTTIKNNKKHSSISFKSTKAASYFYFKTGATQGITANHTKSKLPLMNFGYNKPKSNMEISNNDSMNTTNHQRYFMKPRFKTITAMSIKQKPFVTSSINFNSQFLDTVEAFNNNNCSISSESNLFPIKLHKTANNNPHFNNVTLKNEKVKWNLDSFIKRDNLKILKNKSNILIRDDTLQTKLDTIRSKVYFIKNLIDINYPKILKYKTKLIKGNKK